MTLEYGFGECDLEQGGGGLEAHLCLINSTLYTAADSVTTMKGAREIVLAMGPTGFTISHSSCYNYTEDSVKEVLRLSDTMLVKEFILQYFLKAQLTLVLKNEFLIFIGPSLM